MAMKSNVEAADHKDMHIERTSNSCSNHLISSYGSTLMESGENCWQQNHPKQIGTTSTRADKKSRFSQRVGKLLSLQIMTGKQHTSDSLLPNQNQEEEKGEEEHVGKKISEHQLKCNTNSRWAKHMLADTISTTNVLITKTGLMTPIFPARCQPNNINDSWPSIYDVGWPLGIPNVSSNGVSPKQQHKTNNGLETIVIPSPPSLPPSPRGSWLRKALLTNACKLSSSTLLCRKEKMRSSKSTSEQRSAHGKTMRWEDVVKGSWIEQPDHLRFSEVHV